MLNKTLVKAQYNLHKQSSRGAFENFAKLTGKRLCQSLFFNKVVGLRPATLLKKRFWHKCFPVNFVTFLRATLYRTPPVAAFEPHNIF